MASALLTGKDISWDPQRVIVSKTDLKGNITYANDNFSKVSQYTKEELLGNNHRIIRDKNMSSFIFKKMWQTIKNGKIWKGEWENGKKILN